MAAITNLNQIAGATARIRWLHRARQPNPLTILLLSDGFVEADQNDFEAFLRKLSERFFRIAPFHYCKQYINILYWYGESRERGIGPQRTWEPSPPSDDWRTIFRSYVDAVPLPFAATTGNTVGTRTFSIPAGGLNNFQVPGTEQTPEVLATVDRLCLRIQSGAARGVYVIQEFLSDTDLLLKQTATFNEWRDLEGGLSFDIALNRHIASWDSQRVIDVVNRLELPADLLLPEGLPRTPASVWFSRTMNARSHGAVCVVANCTGATGQSLSNDAWRYFLIDLSGFEPRATNLYGGFEHVFAHELVHSFRLGDEYEVRSTFPTTSEAEFINNAFTNVFAAGPPVGGLSDPPTEEFIDAITWKSLLSQSERDAILAGDAVYSKDFLVSKDIIAAADEYKPFKEVFDTIPGEPDEHPRWTDMFLVEGGHRFARDVYRSNLNCKMRHSHFDETRVLDPTKYKVSERTRDEYGSPEFCRVCNYQIRKHITGLEEYGFMTPHRLRIQRMFYGDVVPRVEQSFKLEDSTLSVDQALCEVASGRAFIVMRQLKLSPKFVVTGMHVSLWFQGVLLDPTFYDLYRISNDAGPLSYLDPANGQPVEFSSTVTKRGFAGDLLEIENYFHMYVPLPGSYAQVKAAMSLPAWTQEAVARIYVPETRWVGPEEDPDGTQANLFGYFNGIKMQWIKWKAYLETGEPAHMAPLRIRR